VEKTIITAFMVIISVIVSVMVYNTVYPAAVEGSASLRNMRARMDDRIQSQIAIVHAVGELDQNGNWQDTNGDGDFSVMIWSKNIGAARIAALNSVDLFFGPEGNFSRIAHRDETGGAYPYWEWDVENGDSWDPTTTLKITIRYTSPLPTGRYFIKIVLPNGLSTEYFFSL
jgi:archaellum component FlaG (FlaF/FlaG flagellin family)